MARTERGCPTILLVQQSRSRGAKRPPRSRTVMARTERGCPTILLVPGDKVLTSLFGTSTLGDLQPLGLVLKMCPLRRGRQATSLRLWSGDVTCAVCKPIPDLRRLGAGPAPYRRSRNRWHHFRYPPPLSKDRG